MPVSKGAQL